MTHPTQLRRWHVALLLGCFIAFGLRYAAAVDSGMGHVSALRAFVFWGVVCIPLAYLADMILRSILEYQFMQPALARLSSRR